MRSTRASAAVERLKTRSDNPLYSLVRNADGMFYLVLGNAGNAPPTPQSEAMPMDDFIKFVNAFGPQKPKRVSKLDLAFEAQLGKKKPPTS